MMEKTRIIAHRGSKGTHPENTLLAFEEAIRVGSDGIELDVHLTSDGHLVVIHDETIDRTSNGKGLVRDFSLAELKRLDMGSWFNPKYKSCHIPTLKEVINLLNEWQFNGLLNIEFKTDKYDYPGIERKVLDTLNQQVNTFSIVFSSFNFQTLIRLKKLDKKVEIALLFEESQEEITLLDNHIPIKMWHPSLEWFQATKWSQTQNIPVRIWTINKEKDMIYCFNKKVAGIFTDFPQKALIVRNNK